MKVPTSGTSVFSPTLATFSGTTVTNTGFVVDMAINKNGVATVGNNFVLDRLRGSNNSTGQQTISTNTTSAESASSGRVALTGSVTIQNGFLEQNTTANNIVWAFQRAPSFFDVVCYTGTGSTRTVTHNLGAVPELIIVKKRSGTARQWAVQPLSVGTRLLVLNATNAQATDAGPWANTNPTSSVFTVGGDADTNPVGDTLVAYLFATCAGVSKVGSYTGTAALLTVNLSADEIQDIYPEFADMTDFEDTEELEQAIEEYMNMNYMDHVQYSDGALDECTISVLLEDDGNE